jgi:hypothetical protein
VARDSITMGECGSGRKRLITPKVLTVLDHSNTGIAGLNPTGGMDYAVPCFRVYVRAVGWANPLFKIPTKFLGFVGSDLILNENKQKGLIRES